MAELDNLTIAGLSMGPHKVVDTLAHSQSSTNMMSKSVSGASLASSQSTQRTKCSSGFSSISGSVRGVTLSSTPASPNGGEAVGSDVTAATTMPDIAPATRGGGNTVLGGVAPSIQGTLRRRARFSGWKTEAVYFELRSTALLAFAGGNSNGYGGNAIGSSNSSSNSGTGGSNSLASLAAKIMQSQHRQPGDWSWSLDLAGAERVVELPALSKKGAFAFTVEFPVGSKKKPPVLAAASATARERWMVAMNRARRSVKMQVFEPLSVIGEGHFGKVLLVRWKNGASSSRTDSAPTSAALGPAARTLPSSLAEVEEEEDGSITSGSSNDPHINDRFLAVKEVALHKGTSLPGVLNERQILGVLREHPFVVTLRCAWRRGNFLYYGLDFLAGADLFELFRRNAIKMDLQAARVYGGQVALALEHLHAHGICYRDLKPENILVNAKGHLCLADMGLSKILGTGEDQLRTSTVCGTRAYLAPEMIMRKPYGLSVDFWQFGCFLFELYAGHSPFWIPRSGPPGRSNDQTVALILAGEIHYPRSIEPVAKALIRDLLHPQVDNRLGCGGVPLPFFPAPRPVAPRSSAASLDAMAEGVKSSAPRSNHEGQQQRQLEESNVGWKNVKEHGFFRDMDWAALLKGDIAAPIQPGGLGRGMVGNFSREYTRQRAGWGGDQQELRDIADKEGLFKRELMGFDFVRD